MNIRSLSIVIPCYNEATRIPVLLKELEEFIATWPTPCEVIYVNDGSKDSTVEVITSSSLFHTQSAKGLMKVVDNKVNMGKGYALRSGVLQAQFSRILTMDADVATHPDQLNSWSASINGNFDEHTVYVASRKHQQSHITDKNIRKLSGYVFNRLVKMISPLKLDDTQCGFKLYPEAIAKKVFTDLKTFGWAHDVELLCRCKEEGYTIVELPVEWTAIEGSKISVVRDSIKMFLELIRIKGIVKRDYRKK